MAPAPTTTLKGGTQRFVSWLVAKAEQTATEVSLMQLAAGGLPVRRRRNYQRYENRLLTIKEKYEAIDYTLSELVKAFNNSVSF